MFLKIRCLNPHGLLFINVPSVSQVHRYPVDNWRFFRGTGEALAKYGRIRGENIRLIHSSTLPDGSEGKQIELYNQDTTMIFYKEPSESDDYIYKSELTVSKLINAFRFFKIELILRTRKFLNIVYNVPHYSSEEDNKLTTIQFIPFDNSELSELELFISSDIFFSSGGRNLDDRFFKFVGCVASTSKKFRQSVLDHIGGYPISHQNLADVYSFNISIPNENCPLSIPLLVPSGYSEIQIKELVANLEKTFQYGKTYLEESIINIFNSYKN